MAIFGGMAGKMLNDRSFLDVLRQAAEQRPPITTSGTVPGLNTPLAVAPLPGGRRPAASRVEQVDPRIERMLGPPPQGPNGKRNLGQRLRGALPGLSAAGAILEGDYALAAQINLAADRQRAETAEQHQKANQRYAMAMEVARLPGITPREFAAFLENPEQWASHMADALSTHHAAANVGQTETRVYGNPMEGGTAYQPPRLIDNGVDQIRHDPMTGQNSVAFSGMTDGEQYARSLGLQPGTPAWNQAVQDAELASSGPTAFNNATQLEQLRQGNRMQLRGSPTYAQSNPRAPSPRRSRGGGGGGSSQPVQVRTVEEANALPPGTLYRTPDGRTRRR